MITLALAGELEAMQKRLHERASAFTPAVITGNGQSIDCCVRDLSVAGAKLRVADATSIPQEFQLLLKGATQTRRAKVRWRRRGEVGVVFVADRRMFGRRSSSPTTA